MLTNRNDLLGLKTELLRTLQDAQEYVQMMGVADLPKYVCLPTNIAYAIALVKQMDANEPEKRP